MESGQPGSRDLHSDISKFVTKLTKMFRNICERDWEGKLFDHSVDPMNSEPGFAQVL